MNLAYLLLLLSFEEVLHCFHGQLHHNIYVPLTEVASIEFYYMVMRTLVSSAKMCNNKILLEHNHGGLVLIIGATVFVVMFIF